MAFSGQEHNPHRELESRDGGPLPMQFFSTWEVRKVPVNCMSRLCTLNITKLVLLRPIESELQSVVLAISMKTPHRSLRSNELQVPSNGILNITLNLTFSLQYPHFIKRGGNVLEIRLQRRKRYRNRTIRGYKTLLRGEVNMSHVLQKSYQGVVKLISDKTLNHMADVMVSSLTSVPTEMEIMKHTIDASSEEDDETDEDTDSLENMDPQTFDEECEPHEFKVNLRQPSSVLRLLKFKARGRHTRQGVPVEVTLGLDEEEEGVVEGVESVALSSLSDSYEEDDDDSPTHDKATPRPRLRPFFGSDTLSLMSSTQCDIEGGPMSSTLYSHYDKRYGSLELAGIAARNTHSQSPTETLEPLDMPESGLLKGRLWLINETNRQLHHVLYSMDEPLLTTPTNPTSSSFLSLLNTLSTLWRKDYPFLLILDEGHILLSSLIKAFVFGPTLPCNFHQFSANHMMLQSLLLKNKDNSDGGDGGDGDDVEDNLTQAQDIIADFISTLSSISTLQLLPIAQAEINIPPHPVITTIPSSLNPSKKFIPFIYNISIGPWDIDTKLHSNNTPSSPSNENSSEILLEYWNGKQKSSVKVRSVMVTVVSGSLLNVSAIIRKKILRIRRAAIDGTIMSLSASHLSCKNTNKEELKVCIDGVDMVTFDVIKLSAQWEQTINNRLPVLTLETDQTSLHNNNN